MNTVIDGLAAWMSSHLCSLEFPIRIPASPYVPGGVNADCTGVEEVLAKYRWNGKDWKQTKEAINRLKRDLAAAIRIKDANRREQECLEACLRIICWGGERNRRVGARPFLRGKRKANSLVEYLAATTNALRVRLPVNPEKFRPVEKMNSMLTKVHAFHSEDGLPIYDSRVTFAAAALVEIYRRESGLRWNSVPSEVVFPGIDQERRIKGYGNQVCDPGFLYRNNQAICTLGWCSAMVRLGSLFQRVLSSTQMLFRTKGTLPKRMHALEASFFMLGCNLNTFEQYLGRGRGGKGPKL